MSPAFAETADVDVTTTLTECQGGDGQIASPCKISWRPVKLLRRYGDFRFFKIAVAAILNFQFVEILGVG